MRPINFRKEPTASLVRLLGARRTSLRKYRLFAVACCRFDIDKITDPDCRALIDLSERWADDPSVVTEVRKLRRKVLAWANNQSFAIKRWIGIYGAYQTAKPSGPPVHGFMNTKPYRPLLADIVGPSPMTSAFLPEWRTSTAVAIARQMYDARDFSGMPILADALQEAGCEDKGILAHCRDTKQTHVRGCWVCDFVLNKK